MNFLNPKVFWLLPVIIPAMIAIYWWAAVRRQKTLKAILGDRYNDPEHVLVDHARRNLRFFILCLSVVFLIVALARPWWQMSIVPYQAKGRDLMVLFDVSKSMLAEDTKPSRLEHAKWLMRELTKKSGGDRYGLVAFAGEAFLECPLTRDMTSFNQYLNELDTTTIPLAGTNLQRALETAANAFKSAEGDNRAIILITDGEELEGNSSQVINELRAKKIPLFIIGLGDPNTPALIPNQDEKGKVIPGFKRDGKGELVKTKLNEAQLRKLRQEIPESLYIRSTTTDPGLEQLQAKIDALAPKDLDGGTRTKPIERFQYFIAGALALLGLWLLISERRGLKHPPKAAKAAVLLLFFGLLLPGFSQQAVPPMAPQQPGQPQSPLIMQQPAPQPGQPQPAPDFPDPSQKEQSGKLEEASQAVTNPIVLYNLARETQLKKQPGAEQLYEKAINLSADQPKVRSHAFHNLGVLVHEKARAAMVQANTQLEKNLDEADKALGSAQQVMNQAEEHYVRSLVEAASEKDQKQRDGMNQSFAANQQLLLRDHQISENIRKDIKEYKEAHKQAIAELKQAIAQQQRENQQKEPTVVEIPAMEKIQQSQATVSKLEMLSQKLRQQQMSKDAAAANKEINLGLTANQNKKGQEAEKHLVKALEILEKKDKNQDKNKDQQKQDQNKDQQKQDQNKDQQKQDQNKDQQKQDQNKDQQKQDQNKDQQKQDQKQDQQKQDQQQNSQMKPDQQLPKEQPAQAQPQKGEEQKIDPKQAKNLLELMAKDEKNLRDALKQNRMKNNRNMNVEKDW